jgi:glycosyltransferase involved in cell wall biosynthesis
MNLLYLIDSLDVGGAETLLVNTINELVLKTDWNIAIGTTQKPDGKLKEKLSPSVTYLHFDCAGIGFLGGIKSINRFIRNHKIDLVHAHSYNSIIISRVASNKKVKLGASYHNLDFNPSSVYYSKARVFLDKLTFPKKSFSIYVSEQVKNSVERIRKGDSKFYVLPNFADKKFYPVYKFNERACLKIIAVGNLKEVKNFELAVSEMAYLKNEPIHIDIYGDGPLHQELSDNIQLNQVNVSLMGKKEISPELLKDYDVFLMTSKNEGMPISLLEAISCGLPCILPDQLPIMKEVADSAALYFSINKPSDLASKLSFLLNNKPELQHMSTMAVKRSGYYSIEKHTQSIISIYHGA